VDVEPLTFFLKIIIVIEIEWEIIYALSLWFPTLILHPSHHQSGTHDLQTTSHWALNSNPNQPSSNFQANIELKLWIQIDCLLASNPKESNPFLFLRSSSSCNPIPSDIVEPNCEPYYPRTQKLLWTLTHKSSSLHHIPSN
jgi:hypothetical protein